MCQKNLDKSREQGRKALRFFGADQCLTEFDEEREWSILKEQYLEAGRAEGEVIGADKLGRLMTALLSQNRIDDAKIASSDPEYREKLFKEFGIN